MKPHLYFTILLPALILTIGCAGKNSSRHMPPQMPPLPPPPPCCCLQCPQEAHMLPGIKDHHTPPSMPMHDRSRHPEKNGMGGVFSPKAVLACVDKENHETCTFDAHGWMLTGVCETFPDDDYHSQPPHGEEENISDAPRSPSDNKKSDDKKLTPSNPLVCSPTKPHHESPYKSHSQFK